MSLLRINLLKTFLKLYLKRNDWKRIHTSRSRFSLQRLGVFLEDVGLLQRRRQQNARRPGPHRETRGPTGQSVHDLHSYEATQLSQHQQILCPGNCYKKSNRVSKWLVSTRDGSRFSNIRFNYRILIRLCDYFLKVYSSHWLCSKPCSFDYRARARFV